MGPPLEEAPKQAAGKPASEAVGAWAGSSAPEQSPTAPARGREGTIWRWIGGRSPRWNLPNALTILRLLLIPAILLIFDAHLSNKEVLATSLFLLAALTDTLDGRIARRS